MELPINWQLGGLNNFSGSVWFIKWFNVPQLKVKDYFTILQFNGVDYFSNVWINDKYIGEHEGYFQRFFLDVSKVIKFGKSNLLIVKVTSPKETPIKVWPDKKKLIKGIFNHHDCRPGGWNLNYGQDQNTGGIWNDVEIIFHKSAYIQTVLVNSEVDITNRSATVKIKAIILSIKNVSSTKIQFEITSPYNKKIICENKFLLKKGKNEIEYNFDLDNVLFWWPWDLGRPNLYNLKIDSSSFAEISIDFGIKKVELDEYSNFIINDKKLFLRGTNIIPTQFLSELKSDRIKKIVRLIKHANINIVRVHAHVNRQELYEELDSQGILVWQDFSLQWTYDDSIAFHNNAVRQIKEMVMQFCNHPSIAFWCCHNEPGDQVETLDKKLFNAVKSIDQSRIIRTASNYEEHPYEGWYWGKADNYISTPMGPLVTEFGAQGLPNKKSLQKFIPKDKLFPPDIDYWEYHNFQSDQTFNVVKIKVGNSIDEFVNNSQQYQSKLLHKAIHYYRRKKNEGITGIFQFMFIDCWPSITWSVVDYFIQKKLAYETLQKAFSPILLSVDLRQEQYFPGSKLNVEFWIINDSYKEYKNLSILIMFDEKILTQIKNLNIKDNTKIYLSFESLLIKLPLKIKSGEHNITFKLLDSKKNLISFDYYQINIVQKNIEEFLEK